MLGEKENYKYLEILEVDTIKQAEMKKKIRKEYLRQTKKLHKTKLCSRNLIKGINTWEVPLVRYLRSFMKRIQEGLRQMDQMTKKLLTKQKALQKGRELAIALRTTLMYQ